MRLIYKSLSWVQNAVIILNITDTETFENATAQSIQNKFGNVAALLEAQ